MKIPISNAKYNLLGDANHSEKVKAILHCVYFTIAFILFSPCIYFFFFYVIRDRDNSGLEEENFANRAELYSYDEYVNGKSLCELCDSPPDVIENISIKENNPLKLVCYYTCPESKDIPDVLMPENIECNLCTHINVGFATINNNTIFLSDVLKNIISQVVNLKTCNKQLKVLLSVGGGVADSGFPDMVKTHATRKEFIRSVKSLLRQYRLDGVDLDWEFPVIPTTHYKEMGNKTVKLNKRQRQHFSQLLREMRTEYIREKRPYILSVAVAAPMNIVNIAYDVKEINQYADYINLMSYDYHYYTKFTPFTGINSPLYSEKADLQYLSTMNINYSVNLWRSKGMDRDKIVVGLPTYGHSFSLINKNNWALESPANGFGKLGSFGFVSYSAVCGFINNNTNVDIVFDNRTYSPYLHKDYEWVSFEDRDSILTKGKYVRDSGLGGAMIFSLNTDDYSGHCSDNSEVKFFLTRHLKDMLADNDL